MSLTPRDEDIEALDENLDRRWKRAYLRCPFLDEVIAFEIDEGGNFVCPKAVDPVTGRECPMKGSKICLHGRLKRDEY